ncbi:MAG TPA: tetratricopeptide repeat protein [Stellaceae bacterium]
MAALIAAATGLSGCLAHAINEKNGLRYHDAGLEAEQAGDFKTAERDYLRALINFRDGELPESYLSMELYNLGRMEGHNCNYADAKAHLLDALHREERLSGPESSLTTKRLFELARLSYDRGEYADAAIYYGRGIPAARKLGIEKTDPITLANALDEYGTALRNAERPEEAKAAVSAADGIRASHPGEKAKYNFVRYTRRCDG